MLALSPSLCLSLAPLGLLLSGDPGTSFLGLSCCVRSCQVQCLPPQRPSRPSPLGASPPSGSSLLPSVAAGDRGPSSSSPWSLVAACVHTVLPPASSVPPSGPSRWHGGALSPAYRPRVPGPTVGGPCPTPISGRPSSPVFSSPCSFPHAPC